MLTKISKHGNSFVIILPKHLAKAYKWKEGYVEIDVDGDRIIIRRFVV